MLKLNVGVTDSKICLNKCSIFKVTFPVVCGDGYQSIYDVSCANIGN